MKPVVLVDATMLDGLPSGAATRLAAMGAAHEARAAFEVVHLVRPDADPLPGLRCLPFARADTPWRRAFCGRRLGALVRGTGARLVQLGALPLPRVPGTPLLLTLHDLRWLDPDEPQPLARRLWARHAAAGNLARARRIVTVSASTACALAAAGLTPGCEAAVVPNAGTPGLSRVEDVDRLASFRRAMGLAGRFVLVVGPLGAHKRAGFLLEVLAAARRAPRAADLGLVWAGRAEPAPTLTFAERARALGLHEAVRVAGVLEPSRLAEACSSAEALLVAGTSEGFSIPVVDAQRCDLPVVAAASGALPEVAGDAAWSAPAGDVQAFAAAVVAALEAGAERERRLAEGRRLAARWSWECSAERLEALWSDALSPASALRS